MIFHDSQADFYRSPFGAVSSRQDILLRLEVDKKIQTKKVTLRLWQDGAGEKKLPMELFEKRANGAIYQVRFSAPKKPCLLWYYFIVDDGSSLLYYGNQPDTLGGMGQVYREEPPSYQITVYKEGAVTPDWFKESVMYQIFPDRFYRGTPEILSPKPGSLLHSHWENTPYYVRDVDTKRIVAYDFFGGNLQGIMEKLSYLKELGIRVVYLNPIFLSPSNHRYDTADYKNIDPMLGDNETFAALCAKAREMGISILLDGVFSHTGSDSIYFNREGTYPAVGAFQSEESPYYKWFRFREHPHEYECWWGIDTLPNVEEMEPSYVDYIIEGKDSVIRHWLKLGAKGWRLDVADELPDAFIQKIYKVMKETDEESVLIGEVWEDASRKSSYGQLRQYLQGEELDSVMNYPFRDVTLAFILNQADAQQTHRALMSLYENYPKENFYAMMNLVGTHDVPRILTLLGQAPEPDSMPVGEQAKYKLPPARRRLAIDRLKLLSLWQMTFPGVPCIYYGDEAGLEGYKDPFNRGTYPWGREDQEIQGWYKKVIALRNESVLFTKGDFVSLPLHTFVYGYTRSLEGSTAMVLLNSSVDETVTVDIHVRPWFHGTVVEALHGEECNVCQGKLQVTLRPLEGKVFLQKEEPVFERECGILLHPTSLPSKYGIGDLGKDAYEFIDFLHAGKQKLWQILPLNPVGFGQSPYQCFSAFAGNPLLISPGRLVTEGLLSAQTLKDSPVFPQDRVDFTAVEKYKEGWFRKAFQVFCQQERPAEYTVFLKENSHWLSDYGLFMALRKHFNGLPWNQWPKEVVQRQPAALKQYRQLLGEEVEYQYFLQYIFFTQWQALKNYAGQKGIRLVGDVPIFVSHDSSDVWAHQELFDLDGQGKPRTVAGVPPDYFSEDGQLWGNPHYQWERMAKNDYSWWRERFQILFRLVDIVRVDHFRGFESFWEVPATAKTAAKGRWVKGPGAAFFRVLEKHLGKLPIIVEDLGIITWEVEDLKYELGYPGIKVLHFSFQRDVNGCCLPIHYEKNLAVYTGTHDNNTTCGWYAALSEEQPELAACVRQTVGLAEAEDAAPGEVCRRLVEFAYASKANTVVIPLQDLLELGAEARMNFPGTVGGTNWSWRCAKEHFMAALSARLAKLAEDYTR